MFSVIAGCGYRKTVPLYPGPLPAITFSPGVKEMKRQNGKKFAEKHESNAPVNEKIKDTIMHRAKNNDLSCAVAFKIAAELNVSPAEVGKTADLMEISLVKCQLGLFGYTPEKKIVKPKAAANPDLATAIQDARVEGRLPCESAWEIARRFDVSKMTVSSVCEQLNIKVKPCQLGAF